MLQSEGLEDLWGLIDYEPRLHRGELFPAVIAPGYSYGEAPGVTPHLQIVYGVADHDELYRLPPEGVGYGVEHGGVRLLPPCVLVIHDEIEVVQEAEGPEHRVQRVVPPARGNGEAQSGTVDGSDNPGHTGDRGYLPAVESREALPIYCRCLGAVRVIEPGEPGE